MAQTAQTDSPKFTPLSGRVRARASTDLESFANVIILDAHRRIPAPAGSTAQIKMISPWSRADTEPMPEDAGSDKPSDEDRLHADLLAYTSLPEGWDGFDGVAASLDAVMDAISFLEIRPGDIPIPSPEIASDGEVGLYWRSEKVFAEVGFYGNGEYSFYARYLQEREVPLERGLDHCNFDTKEWAEGLLFIVNKLDR